MPKKLYRHGSRLKVVQKNKTDIEYRVVENSWTAKLAAWKLGAVSVAFVLGKTIYLFNVTKDEFLQNKTWVRHELCHVRQFKQYGFIPFIARYLLQSIRHGYYNNKYEKEAREAEKEI